ncbi:inositol monophosphatase family protein [Actinosynnema sp. NPDC053489]|uniref:inositol monophosphatase family protein n=1 Tax=Actinosynnema sp. NPDC053489 TaxID=3363916 RepID=UPI0037CBDADE
MKRPLDQLAEIARTAVGIGNDLIKNARPQKVSEKADRDTYTDVDVRIERRIRSFLADTTPDIDFLGEEEGHSSQTTDSKHFWALDPIDGTANFTHDLPFAAVQISLIIEDSPVVAAVALPFWNKIYWATSGGGAYANGEPIRVSTTTQTRKAIVSIGDYAVGDGAQEKNKKRLAVTGKLAHQVERIRMFGSAAHDFVWLAEGRLDGVIILSNQIVDVAAGALIAKEAGGAILDSSGNQYSTSSIDVVAAGPNLIEAMLSIAKTSE